MKHKIIVEIDSEDAPETVRASVQYACNWMVDETCTVTLAEPLQVRDTMPAEVLP